MDLVTDSTDIQYFVSFHTTPENLQGRWQFQNKPDLSLLILVVFDSHALGARRMAAIMFTDIVGYTSMTQRDESSAAAPRGLQGLIGTRLRRLQRPRRQNHRRRLPRRVSQLARGGSSTSSISRRRLPQEGRLRAQDKGRHHL
jgi:hypothetical protein